MKLKNPLRNYLTPNEQRILLFFATLVLLGSWLDFTGWTPLEAKKTDLDSLRKVVQVDAPLNLDIRSAGREELMTLRGIGEKRAQDIISFRQKKPFSSVNQLLQVKGIGAKTYANILPDLLVFGDSTNLESVSQTSAKTKGKSTRVSSSPKSELTTIVNINTASLKQLCTLVGIGEVKAKAIIAWREENGAFASVEDITQVKGIGEKTYQKNKHRLSIGR
ncbi:MAG: helix-hairpin-helix domain-containing protein [Candidatus Neomarinimicrobiota bacterium]|nr:helix-hairpin-helix domain-containing protein [Candidatus Cloacimonadota bacterium]